MYHSPVRWKETLLDSDPSRIWLTYGRAFAHRKGLNSEDADDFASAFALRVWQHRAEIPREPARRTAWLRACALHLFQDRLRQKRALHTRQRLWSAQEVAENSPALTDFPDPHPSPTAQLERQEIDQHLLQAVKHLSPRSQQIFLRHALFEEPLTEIAHTLNMTYDATCAVYMRSCRRLRSLLIRQGFDEQEARRCLANVAPPPPN